MPAPPNSELPRFSRGLESSRPPLVGAPVEWPGSRRNSPSFIEIKPSTGRPTHSATSSDAKSTVGQIQTPSATYFIQNCKVLHLHAGSSASQNPVIPTIPAALPAAGHNPTKLRSNDLRFSLANKPSSADASSTITNQPQDNDAQLLAANEDEPSSTKSKKRRLRKLTTIDRVRQHEAFMAQNMTQLMTAFSATINALNSNQQAAQTTPSANEADSPQARALERLIRTAVSTGAPLPSSALGTDFARHSLSLPETTRALSSRGSTDDQRRNHSTKRPRKDHARSPSSSPPRGDRSRKHSDPNSHPRQRTGPISSNNPRRASPPRRRARHPADRFPPLTLEPTSESTAAPRLSRAWTPLAHSSYLPPNGRPTPPTGPSTPRWPSPSPAVMGSQPSRRTSSPVPPQPATSRTIAASTDGMRDPPPKYEPPPTAQPAGPPSFPPLQLASAAAEQSVAVLHRKIAFSLAIMTSGANPSDPTKPSLLDVAGADATPTASQIDMPTATLLAPDLVQGFYQTLPDYRALPLLAPSPPLEAGELPPSSSAADRPRSPAHSGTHALGASGTPRTPVASPATPKTVSSLEELTGIDEDDPGFNTVPMLPGDLADTTQPSSPFTSPTPSGATSPVQPLRTLTRPPPALDKQLKPNRLKLTKRLALPTREPHDNAAGRRRLGRAPPGRTPPGTPPDLAATAAALRLDTPYAPPPSSARPLRWANNHP